jgi:hypothetical protein
MMDHFIRKIDGYLADLRKVLTVSAFEKMEALFSAIASFCTPISAIVGALIVFVVAIKQDSLQIFLFAFSWLPIVVVCYYIAIKMKAACAKTLKNNPSSIANQEYLDVSAVIGVVSVVSFVLAGFFLAIKESDIEFFLYAVLIAAFLCYSTWIMLQPSLIATNVRNSSSGGIDAISILTMGSKVYLRSTTVVIGLSSIAGLLMLARAFYMVLFKPDEFLMGGVWSAVGFMTVVGGLLAPIVIYSLFILGYLLLDVLRSILMMPKAGEPLAQNVMVDPLPVQAPMSSHAPEIDHSPSPQTLKILAVSLVVLMVLVLAMTKGKEWYEDYQIRSEISRIEREKKVAEERIRIEAEQAAAQRKIQYIENAKKYIGKPPIELVLNDEINSELNALVGKNISVVEGFFEAGEPVTMVDNLVLASGCQQDACEQFKALLVVDLNQLTSYLLILIDGDEPRYIGIEERNVPPAVRKWIMSKR